MADITLPKTCCKRNCIFTAGLNPKYALCLIFLLLLAKVFGGQSKNIELLPVNIMGDDIIGSAISFDEWAQSRILLYASAIAQAKKTNVLVKDNKYSSDSNQSVSGLKKGEVAVERLKRRLKKSREVQLETNDGSVEQMSLNYDSLEALIVSDPNDCSAINYDSSTLPRSWNNRNLRR